MRIVLDRRKDRLPGGAARGRWWAEGRSDAARVFLEEIPPQRCGRVLHVGPHADEPWSFAAIARALEVAGLAPASSRLEVHLSDPRRTAPAKLRTVLLRERA